MGGVQGVCSLTGFSVTAQAAFIGKKSIPLSAVTDIADDLALSSQGLGIRSVLLSIKLPEMTKRITSG